MPDIGYAQERLETVNWRKLSYRHKLTSDVYSLIEPRRDSCEGEKRELHRTR